MRGIMWYVKRKTQSWGYVEDLLQKSSQKYTEEQNLYTPYFVSLNVEPTEEFDRIIYKMCKYGDISTETNYKLYVNEVLSLDEFVKRYQYV